MSVIITFPDGGQFQLAGYFFGWLRDRARELQPSSDAAELIEAAGQVGGLHLATGTDGVHAEVIDLLHQAAVQICDDLSNSTDRLPSGTCIREDPDEIFLNALPNLIDQLARFRTAP